MQNFKKNIPLMGKISSEDWESMTLEEMGTAVELITVRFHNSASKTRMLLNLKNTMRERKEDDMINRIDGLETEDEIFARIIREERVKIQDKVNLSGKMINYNGEKIFPQLKVIEAKNVMQQENVQKEYVEEHSYIVDMKGLGNNGSAEMCGTCIVGDEIEDVFKSERLECCEFVGSNIVELENIQHDYDNNNSIRKGECVLPSLVDKYVSFSNYGTSMDEEELVIRDGNVVMTHQMLVNERDYVQEYNGRNIDETYERKKIFELKHGSEYSLDGSKYKYITEQCGTLLYNERLCYEYFDEKLEPEVQRFVDKKRKQKEDFYFTRCFIMRDCVMDRNRKMRNENLVNSRVDSKFWVYRSNLMKGDERLGKSLFGKVSHVLCNKEIEIRDMRVTLALNDILGVSGSLYIWPSFKKSEYYCGSLEFLDQEVKAGRCVKHVSVEGHRGMVELNIPSSIQMLCQDDSLESFLMDNCNEGVVSEFFLNVFVDSKQSLLFDELLDLSIDYDVKIVQRILYKSHLRDNKGNVLDIDELKEYEFGSESAYIFRYGNDSQTSIRDKFLQRVYRLYMSGYEGDAIKFVIDKFYYYCVGFEKDYYSQWGNYVTVVFFEKGREKIVKIRYKDKN